MTTSRYKTILIKTPDNLYLVIGSGVADSVYKNSNISFPVYGSDLVLEQDRLPEYELIKHLPCKDIFNYFIEDLNNVPTSHTGL